MTLFYKLRYHSLMIKLRALIPNRWVNLFKHLPTAVLANLFFRFPARHLTIVGVTGTDGKTTTANYLYHILDANGLKVALISTVAAKIGQETLDTGFHVTSPDHFPLQALLRKIVNKHLTHLVLEVTSHGLEQYRFWGVPFTGGVVTNVSEDHLDYHGSWLNYLKAKARLFRHTRFAVLNQEDKSYRFLKPLTSGKIITYGLQSGQVNLESCGCRLPDLTPYNQQNLLAAIAAAQALGVESDKICANLDDLPRVKGRMEVMQKEPFLTVVDFAHTPNGLYQALTALRPKVEPGGRLIAVFGCAGERDKSRRRMGKVSGELADITIITAEDPRTEGVKKISADIARWAEKAKAREIKKAELFKRPRKVFLRLDDRTEAITAAVEVARRGDIVGVFGKGHEQSMCFGKTEYPWSDQKTVKMVLKERQNRD